MHADELDIDVALVRRLLRAQCPRWADLPLTPVENRGTDNAVYRLGDDMAVRLPRRERDVAALEKELEWLPRLAPLLPLAIPIPLVVGEPAAEYPWTWSVYRWLDGEDATPERLSDARRAAIDLAGFLVALQGIEAADGPPPGQHNAFRGVPLVERDETVRAWLASLAERVDAAAVMGVWQASLRAPEWQRAPVWIHGDLDSRNVLARAGMVTGVVDFGCLGVGDPACDVAVAWKLLSADARELFRTSLAVDDETWARSRGWALSQALGALAYYTPETNPVLVREARTWLTAVLSEH